MKINYYKFTFKRKTDQFFPFFNQILFELIEVRHALQNTQFLYNLTHFLKSEFVLLKEVLNLRTTGIMLTNTLYTIHPYSVDVENVFIIKN